MFLYDGVKKNVVEIETDNWIRAERNKIQIKIPFEYKICLQLNVSLKWTSRRKLKGL